MKKQKQLRRHIRFYKTCFGFREPFKVICDGTFLHYNLSKKLGSPQDILPSFLGAAAKAFVTRFAISASPYFDLVSVLCLGKPLNPKRKYYLSDHHTVCLLFLEINDHLAYPSVFSNTRHCILGFRV